MPLPDYLGALLGPILAAIQAGRPRSSARSRRSHRHHDSLRLEQHHHDRRTHRRRPRRLRRGGHPGRRRARIARGPVTVSAGLAILGLEYGDRASDPYRARPGLPVSMHAGGPAVRALHDAKPLDHHVHVVHLNTATADDARLLADSAAGVTVTPVVEGTMGHGASADGRLHDAGARPSLGTDVVVNAPVDLFEPLRDALRTERLRTGTMPPAAGVLPAATVDSARAIGLDHLAGTVAVGKRADLVLLRGLPRPSAAAAVVSATPSDVDTVLVDGRVVKRGGRLLDHDLAALRAAGRQLARRVLS